jgi:hypothetical protein
VVRVIGGTTTVQTLRFWIEAANNRLTMRDETRARLLEVAARHRLPIL